MVIRVVDVEEAYVNAQTGGTQLVTTQEKYLDAEWEAALNKHGDAQLEHLNTDSQDPGPRTQDPKKKSARLPVRPTSVSLNLRITTGAC